MYLFSFLWNEILVLIFNMVIYMQQGSPHIVITGRLDISLSWLKGEVRENLGDFQKSIQILTFLCACSPTFHKNERAALWS